MADPVTRESLATKEGRKRAWRGLMLADHGVLRLIYDNTHWIDDQLARTYQPSPGKLAKFAKRGVKTVVNLRGESDTGFFRLEEEACEKLGLELISFKVYSRDAPSKEVLYGAKELFARIQYPAIMHCKSGADRTGLMGTLYKFLHKGEPMEAAMEQLSFRKYGHVRAGKTGVIDYAFEKFIAWRDETGGDFWTWVEEVYDPKAVKAEYLGSWWGNLLTERILRRE